jgi:hypothetical protein
VFGTYPNKPKPIHVKRCIQIICRSQNLKIPKNKFEFSMKIFNSHWISSHKSKKIRISCPSSGLPKNEMSLTSFIFKMMLVLYQSVSISSSISNIYWHARPSISFSHLTVPIRSWVLFPTLCGSINTKSMCDANGSSRMPRAVWKCVLTVSIRVIRSTSRPLRVDGHLLFALRTYATMFFYWRTPCVVVCVLSMSMCRSGCTQSHIQT